MVEQNFLLYVILYNVLEYYLAVNLSNLMLIAIAEGLVVNIDTASANNIRHGNKYYENYLHSLRNFNQSAEVPTWKFNPTKNTKTFAIQNDIYGNETVAYRLRTPRRLHGSGENNFATVMKHINEKLTTKEPFFFPERFRSTTNVSHISGELGYNDEDVAAAYNSELNEEQHNRRIHNRFSNNNTSSGRWIPIYNDTVLKYYSVPHTTSPSSLSTRPLWVSTSSQLPLSDVPHEDESMSSMANKHYHRMRQEAVCRIPKPKVIRVSDLYPSPHKNYFPACTILHQCSDDSGCCGDITKQCHPEKIVNVTLFFIVTQFGKRSQKPERSYEGLSFYNHTECRCRTSIENSMPRDPTYAVVDSGTIMPDSKHNGDTSNPECTCPSEYTTRYIENKSCICDCFDQQFECIRFKKGIRYFDHLDRYCITSGMCLPPTCYYGTYSVKFGRCPTKQENIISAHSLP